VTESKLKTQTGVVVSRSGDKSVKAVIDYKIKHPRYGKYIRKRTTFGLHDEQNICNVGDTVEFTECRPISKSKNHRVLRVVKKAIER